jgi:hypothetical protein
MRVSAFSSIYSKRESAGNNFDPYKKKNFALMFYIMPDFYGINLKIYPCKI